MKQGPVDVSVVIPFSDDEERVGRAARRVVDHLVNLGLSFELLLVDEDSGDNSVALLSLLRAHVPELRIVASPGPGFGFETGARVARGRTLWLLDLDAAGAPLGGFGWAHARVVGNAADVVHVEGRFLVGRRMRLAPVLHGLRGTGPAFERRVLRRARAHHLRVETPPRPRAGGADGASSFVRLIDGLMPARFLGLRRSRA